MQIHAGFPFPFAADARTPSVWPPCDGRIEEVASGAVQGWVAGIDGPPPEVELLVDGVPHLRGPADRPRPDLPWPARGFAAPLPEPLLDGRPHRLELRVAGGAFLQGGPVELEGMCPCDGAVLRVAGGRVFGRVRPASRAGNPPSLEVWDDGVFLLRFAVADHPVPAEEGGGLDGGHAFALTLPPRCFDGANHELRIRDALGRDLAGSPFGYQARPPDHGDWGAQGPMLERAGLLGHLEAVEGRQITGWAFDAFAPGRPVELELCEGEEVVGRISANRLRPPPFGGDGSGDAIPCGFAAEAPESWLDGRPRRVTLRFAGTDIPLRGLPPTLAFRPPSGSAARIAHQAMDEGGGETVPPDMSARLEALQLALAERDRQISSLSADLAAALSGTAPPPPGKGAPPGAPRRVVWCAPPDARTRPALDDVLAMLSRIARDIPVELQRMPVDPPSLPLPCDLALVPAVDGGGAGSGLARPAVLAALARGIPVLAAADPGLPAGLRDLVVRDWEREARRHLAAAASRGGESRIRDTRPAVPAGQQAPVRLLVLIDLPEEVDLLEPVVAAAARRTGKGAGAVALTVVLTDHAATRSTRARTMLARHGAAWTVAERSALLAGRAPDLSAADAVLVGAESDHPSHCVPHALLGRASALGIPCFAVQHGLESIGLTYFDEVHDAGVRLGGDLIFTWFPVAAAPAEMAAEVRRRLCPVGSLREPTLVRPVLPASVTADGRPLVGVFENLHWHRYDDRFRAGFVEALLEAAAARPALRFLVKPHHSARWLGQTPVGTLPANVILADPADPAWEPFTAPALLPALAAVITTPSTVAHDAARAARPVAVAGGDLALPVLAPLPILRRPSDWLAFLDGVLADGGAAALADGQLFLDRHMVPGPAGERILDHICDRVQSTPRVPA